MQIGSFLLKTMFIREAIQDVRLKQTRAKKVFFCDLIELIGTQNLTFFLLIVASDDGVFFGATLYCRATSLFFQQKKLIFSEHKETQLLDSLNQLIFVKVTG